MASIFFSGQTRREAMSQSRLGRQPVPMKGRHIWRRSGVRRTRCGNLFFTFKNAPPRSGEETSKSGVRMKVWEPWTRFTKPCIFREKWKTKNIYSYFCKPIKCWLWKYFSFISPLALDTSMSNKWPAKPFAFGSVVRTCMLSIHFAWTHWHPGSDTSEPFFYSECYNLFYISCQ